MNEPITIIDPKRIDLLIQEFQTFLAELTEIDYCFARCYKTETENGFIPEVYIGQNEYQDVFSTDKNSHLFFDLDDNEIVGFVNNSRVLEKTANISIIVSANLEKIYPNILHRADENLINTIEQKINSFYSTYTATWNLNQVIRKTKNVFQNYSYKISDNLNDMQPYFVCAFKFDLIYSKIC
jgi:hypothetical protein